MLLLIAVVYLCIELKGNYPKGSNVSEALKTWHFMLGLLVLLLVVFRAVLHLSGAVSHTESKPQKWQSLAAKVMHLALYAFMFGMPILGWLILSAEGATVPFFGLEWPRLVEPNKSLSDAFQEIHEAGGSIGYILIGLHAAAALFHHYVVRDNTHARHGPRP